MDANLIGLLAGMFTTAAFVPQVVQVWKTKSTKDISLVMYIVFTIGVTLWLTYGVALNALPIIIANSVTLMLAISILAMKIKYK
jgi:MtN3 and saliva related transmembrane protein